MKIAIVGTYPDGTFARFENALAGCGRALKNIRFSNFILKP